MVPKPDVTAPKRRRSRLIRKRRQTFERFLLAAGGTFVLGLIPGMHWFLLLNVAVDVGILLYVRQLLNWKRQEQEEVAPESTPVPAAREPAYVPAGAEDDTAPNRALRH
jgi:flagellar biosynthesis component FlhA